MRHTPSRRDFLRLTLQATALAALARGRARAAAPGHDAEVLVLGAGMAGLAAAGALQAQGRSVLVLEAREAPGGRVLTRTALGGLPLDLGASWVHGTRGNPVMELVRRHGLPTRPTDYDAVVRFGPDGRRLTRAEQARLEARYREVLAEASARHGAASLGAALEAVLAQLRLDARERAKLEYLIHTELEHELAADVAELPVRDWDDGESYPGGDVLLPQGYGALPARLAKPLDIRYGHAVSLVAHGPGRVRVTTARGAFEAERVVVTLPLGVLRRGAVRFEPPLPEPKQEAVRRLGMGVLNKTFLRFPRAFWDAGAQLLGYAGPRRGRWAEWLNLAPVTGAPLLLGFNAGAYARALEERTDAQVRQEALGVLRALYGRGVPEPEGLVQTRWASDAWAGGAYSFLSAGATPAHRQALAAPVDGRLFFAGEATHSEHPATVHGAWLSGLREARRLGGRD